MQDLLIQQLLLQLQQYKTAHQAPTPIDVLQKDKETHIMSNTELTKMLHMCSLKQGDNDTLPDWLRTCAKKGQSEETKETAIAATLQTKKVFYGVTCPINAPLLNIIKQNWWTRGHLVPTSSTAATGWSVYAFGPLLEEEVVSINEQAAALEVATCTTVAEVKSSRLSAKTLEDTADWLSMLKAYTNATFAIFSSMPPHYTYVKEIVNALHDLKPETRRAISHESKAAILWIILLQARHFAQGSSDELAEFKAMHTQLAAKNTHICHTELPKALIFVPPNPPGKRKWDNEDKREQNSGQQSMKCPATEIHPMLKRKVVDVIARAALSATLTDICKLYNIKLAQLIPDSNTCASNFLGKCVSPAAPANIGLPQMQKQSTSPNCWNTQSKIRNNYAPKVGLKPYKLVLKFCLL
eukprot:10300403-Ditylum_brightwellii.AAC.1